MARRVREGGICVLTLAALCGCPPGPGPGPYPAQASGYVAASPIASGVYVTAYGRSDGITAFRADPAPLGTWVSIDPGLAAPVSLWTDPRSAGTVYAVGAINTGSSTQRLRKSVDGGATWATLLDTPYYLDRVAPDPTVSDRVWITFQAGAAAPLIQRSDDGGQSWLVDDAGLPRSHVVTRLTFDASGSGLRYVALSDGTAYRSDSVGAVHSELTAAPHPNVQADSGVADRVYSWDGDGRLARSDDRGDTWTSLPGGSVVGIRSGGLMLGLTIDPNDPNRLYLSLCPHGVWFSDDGGQTFQPTGLNAETVTRLDVDPTDPSWLMAHTYQGPWVSEDRGVSWRRLDLTTASQEPFTGSAATPPGGQPVGKSGTP